jgi:hypothetical protein
VTGERVVVVATEPGRLEGLAAGLSIRGYDAAHVVLRGPWRGAGTGWLITADLDATEAVVGRDVGGLRVVGFYGHGYATAFWSGEQRRVLTAYADADACIVPTPRDVELFERDGLAGVTSLTDPADLDEWERLLADLRR